MLIEEVPDRLVPQDPFHIGSLEEQPAVAAPEREPHHLQQSHRITDMLDNMAADDNVGGSLCALAIKLPSRKTQFPPESRQRAHVRRIKTDTFIPGLDEFCEKHALTTTNLNDVTPSYPAFAGQEPDQSILMGLKLPRERLGVFIPAGVIESARIEACVKNKAAPIAELQAQITFPLLPCVPTVLHIHILE
jgi:hypothetical protein